MFLPHAAPVFKKFKGEIFLSNFVIFTDANSDLMPEIVNKYNIEVLPMRFTLNDKEYYNYPDLREMPLEDFYKQLRNGGKTATSMTNTAEYEDAFRPTLAAGKDVLYIAFSSGLSGTQNAARLAQNQLLEEFPQRKYIVADTLSASLGQGLLVIKAMQMQKQGKTIEEIAQWVEESGKCLCHWATVDDLHYLKRGGRLSGTAATLGTMLHIKPILYVNSQGKIDVVDKVRGRKNSIMRLFAEMEKNATDIQNQTIFIVHADCADDANLLAEEIRTKLQPKELIVSYVGPVIGGHAGPNTIATFFFANKR